MGIPKDKYFVLKDKTVIKNLFELSKSLDNMQEVVFRHHVNETRNDFYNWIKDVVKNKVLAEKVLKSRSNKEMQKFIKEDIEKEVVKNMEKPVKKIVPTKKTAPVKKIKSPVKTIKINTEKLDNFKKAVINFFSAPKKERKFGKINPKDLRYGTKCPYKTWKCGVLEFLFGIVMGLLIALVLTKVF